MRFVIREDLYGNKLIKNIMTHPFISIKILKKFNNLKKLKFNFSLI